MDSTPSASTTPPRRRHFWRWVGVASAICVIAAIVTVADSFVLSRDAAVLKHAVVAAFPSGLHRQVQLSVGVVGLTAARWIVQEIHEAPPEARQALAAVKAASVGVYEIDRAATPAESTRLFATAEQAMTQRGWTRVVGVHERGQVVAVYLRADAGVDEPQRVCLLVCDHRNIVIASATARPAALVELVASHQGTFALNR